MRTFYWVSGELTEVQRFINVPMRWCEQYPARERRELWVSTPEGQDVKIVVHSRYLPARRGHDVDALLLGDELVGLFNRSTGEGINFVRTDPPLLWRRCDAAVVVGAPAPASPATCFRPGRGYLRACRQPCCTGRRFCAPVCCGGGGSARRSTARSAVWRARQMHERDCGE